MIDREFQAWLKKSRAAVTIDANGGSVDTKWCASARDLTRVYYAYGRTARIAIRGLMRGWGRL